MPWLNKFVSEKRVGSDMVCDIEFLEDNKRATTGGCPYIKNPPDNFLVPRAL
jgi:hypothetical protein